MSKSILRVIHVCPHSARLAGGHTDAIHAYMESQIRHGMDVRGICHADSTVPEALQRSIGHLPMRETDFDAPELCDVLLREGEGTERPLFHFHGYIRRFVPLSDAVNRAGFSYVFTSQGQLHYRDPVHWCKKVVYTNLVVPFFRKAAGLHFVTGREMQRCRYLLPFRGRPVLVQHNVITVPDPATIPRAPRGSFGIPADAFLFGYLGRIHIEHKGLDLLVRGFAKLTRDRNAWLALIGPDWEDGRKRLEGLAKDLGCFDRIRFLGPHMNADKWGLLKMADAFISPSRWDACPSAVGEAIGFGLPTIVSSTMNPAPDYAAAQAVLAPDPTPERLADAMVRMIGDATLRSSLSERGRKWILEHCSVERVGARFEAFYSKILARQ